MFQNITCMISSTNDGFLYLFTKVKNTCGIFFHLRVDWFAGDALLSSVHGQMDHLWSWPSGLVNLVQSEQSRTFLTDKSRVSNPKAYMFQPSKFSFWIWIKPDRPRATSLLLEINCRAIFAYKLLVKIKN